MKDIKIIIPYTKEGINGKDFRIFVRGLRLLKYSVDFIVIGDFPDEYKRELYFIDKWYKCKESEISEVIKKIYKEDE